MAISAGSALIATVSASSVVTASGFALLSTAALKYFLVSTAIGAAINALTPKPGTPKAQGYTVTARGSNLDHQIIYGKTRVGGVVAADFLSGEGGAEGTRFLHRVQVMAGHEVESYEEIYMNSYKVSKWQVRGAGVSGDQVIDDVTDITPYVNQPANILIPVEFVEVASDGTETVVEDLSYKKWRSLAMQFWTGADDQTASSRLISDIPNNQWTSNHRLRGRAYMYIRMGRDADGDNFPTGVPDITAVIKGRKVYDPRNVAHDAADKSTWEWSSNPALCIRDYLTQDFGLGEKDIQVDDTLVATAANVCDSTADDGSTLYTCNGAFTTGIQPYDFLNSILTSMGGLLWYAQGQWRMKPAYWTAPTESFNEDDFRSAISVSTRHSRKDNFNTVQGSFRGPQTNYAETTYPAVTSAASVAADGGIESSIDLEMPFTDTFEEARRIARIVLERNRQQVTLRASFGLKAFRVQVGDVVNLSLERFGWVNKTFEVTEWSFGNVDQYDIQVELTLREITENVFDEVDDGAAFEVDNANVPSPLAGLTVSNLTATAGGFTATDGTFVPNILVDWDAIVNSNVAEYIVEWGRAAFNFADYGDEVTDTGSFTTREQFIFDAYNDILSRNPDQSGFDFYNTGGGSGLTETQIRLQLQNSPEKRAISGSVRVGGETTEYTISPTADDSMYSIRVKAINDFGTSSNWATVTVNAGKDDTVPNAPTNLTATGGFRYITIDWTNPADTDFNYVEVFENSTNNVSGAVSVGIAASNQFVRTNLGINETKWYFLRSVDYSGNVSSFTSGVQATTTFLDDPDFENGIRTLFEEQGLYAIEDVATLPASGILNRKVFNRADGKLYEWNGTAWVLVVAAVEAPDISGQLATNQIELDAITNDLIANDAIQTENIANLAINADKIANLAITTTKITDGAISTPKLEANAVTAAKIAAGTITASEIATGTITATNISSGAITTDKIGTRQITAIKIATNTITANEIASNTITANQIAASTITASEISGNTITGDKIVANTITGGLLATSGIITNTAQINNGLITNAKIGNAEVGTLKIAGEAVTIPRSVDRTNTISGNGSYQTALSYEYTLTSTGTILVIFNTSQEFFALEDWRFEMFIGGTLVAAREGSSLTTTPTLTYSATYLPGTRLVEVKWKGLSSNVQLGQRTLSILGAMK